MEYDPDIRHPRIAIGVHDAKTSVPADAESNPSQGCVKKPSDDAGKNATAEEAVASPAAGFYQLDIPDMPFRDALLAICGEFESSTLGEITVDVGGRIGALCCLMRF